MLCAVRLQHEQRRNHVPTVSRSALQEDIAKRLTDAGEKPESVICKQDLAGEMGTTARCEVVVSANNSFEPTVTVTGVDGDAINYAMTPALSREQLEEVVFRLVVDSGLLDVKAVTCESGMEGIVGAAGERTSRLAAFGYGAPWRGPASAV